MARNLKIFLYIVLILCLVAMTLAQDQQDNPKIETKGCYFPFCCCNKNPFDCLIHWCCCN
ncbi:hypothetical protein MPTK1_4g08650 [Marchantia polymorpha subsp. ruderalis]|uniref:Late nodulin n=2 Tax=Marchantia polymorpha TaxID=3197 RepID=A0AAF6B7U0_MARPO|nr:hypothetical protein MARPO_0157s0014 [Marchantia polymorpha]BBN08074.1 hypothetical protein Mp_4g08650 [Marchantia polymorpha subsp. ruderalis]|eukprot:PTQ28682.1 hypothetical protein MARPO_0157s0014 [Marchantia polymorpha]